MSNETFGGLLWCNRAGDLVQAIDLAARSDRSNQSGMRFFFYGTLMDRELLALVIGRAADGLRVETATIHDFARRRALNESFPILVPEPGGRVEGALVTNLTPPDIDRLKFYEASDYEGSDYALTAMVVECRGELLQAQVYLPTVNLTADETVWDFNTWAADERELFIALVEERMSSYGNLTAAENNALWPEIKARAHARFRHRPGICN